METDYHYEALKLLKEWSYVLVIIQTEAIAVIGTLLKDNAIRNEGPI